jgi:hypothetical protein
MDIKDNQNDDWDVMVDFQEEIREIQENEYDKCFTESHDKILHGLNPEFESIHTLLEK